MTVADNFLQVEKKIRKTAQGCGRDSAAVRLVAVSKVQSEERVRAALDYGHRLFGENRVQEAQARWETLKRDYSDVRLHLIGPLQTNKVKEAVALFDCIETVDREKLAVALAAEMKQQGKALPCLIQVNTGEEPQKAGISPQNLPVLLGQCRAAGLPVTGLMCIPPADQPAALHFALLQKLARDNGFPELSMGMSGDFEKAIPLGATYIRVGTALFGGREA